MSEVPRGFYLLIDVLLVPLRLALWPFVRLGEWMDRSVNPWIRRGVRKSADHTRKDTD